MLQLLLKDYQLVLASKSPRRHELLKGMDLDFIILVKDVDESYPDHLKPDEIASFLCQQKSNAFGHKELPDNYLLITADTIVVVNGMILNKAHNPGEANQMLSTLQGRAHEVITGVCLRSRDRLRVFTDSSEVLFGKLTDEEISWYVDNYKPYDKAGAYGIQEWIGYVGIETVRGSYFNVMGLPTFKLFHELKMFA
jgi:septum formation protein